LGKSPNPVGALFGVLERKILNNIIILCDQSLPDLIHQGDNMPS